MKKGKLMLIAFVSIVILNLLVIRLSTRSAKGEREVDFFLQALKKAPIGFFIDFDLNNLIKDSIFIKLMEKNEQVKNLVQDKNIWNIDLSKDLERITFFSKDISIMNEVFSFLSYHFQISKDTSKKSSEAQKNLENNEVESHNLKDFSAFTNPDYFHGLWIDFTSYDSGDLQERILNQYPAIWEKANYKLTLDQYLGLKKRSDANFNYPYDFFLMLPKGILIGNEGQILPFILKESKESLNVEKNQDYINAVLDEWGQKNHLIYLSIEKGKDIKDPLDFILKNLNLPNFGILDIAQVLNFFSHMDALRILLKLKVQNIKMQEQGGDPFVKEAEEANKKSKDLETKEWVELELILNSFEKDENQKLQKIEQAYKNLAILKMALQFGFKQFPILEHVTDYRITTNKNEMKGEISFKVNISKEKLIEFLNSF